MRVTTPARAPKNTSAATVPLVVAHQRAPTPNSTGEQEDGVCPYGFVKGSGKDWLGEEIEQRRPLPTGGGDPQPAAYQPVQRQNPAEDVTNGGLHTSRCGSYRDAPPQPPSSHSRWTYERGPVIPTPAIARRAGQLQHVLTRGGPPLARASSSRAHPLHPDERIVMNMVEIWFSILTKQHVRCGVYHDVSELIAAIEHFIDGYNERAAPFA